MPRTLWRLSPELGATVLPTTDTPAICFPPLTRSREPFGRQRTGRVDSRGGGGRQAGRENLKKGGAAGRKGPKGHLSLARRDRELVRRAGKASPAPAKR